MKKYEYYKSFIERDKVVVVLIKSNTSLDETVDNILGYFW